MKWVIIKGTRYPISAISAFAAYFDDTMPYMKVRIRGKFHIIRFKDKNSMASQVVYLVDNLGDMVTIGNWYVTKGSVRSWEAKGPAADGRGWVISFSLSFGVDGGTSLRYDKEADYLTDVNRLDELFNVVI